MESPCLHRERKYPEPYWPFKLVGVGPKYCILAVGRKCYFSQRTSGERKKGLLGPAPVRRHRPHAERLSARIVWFDERNSFSIGGPARALGGSAGRRRRKDP